MYFSQHFKAVLLLVEIFAGGQNFRPAVVSRNAERKPNGHSQLKNAPSKGIQQHFLVVLKKIN